jgi:hypothetical protein
MIILKFKLMTRDYSIEEPYYIAQESMIPCPMSSVMAAIQQYMQLIAIGSPW